MLSRGLGLSGLLWCCSNKGATVNIVIANSGLGARGALDSNAVLAELCTGAAQGELGVTALCTDTGGPVESLKPGSSSQLPPCYARCSLAADDSDTRRGVLGGRSEAMDGRCPRTNGQSTPIPQPAVQHDLSAHVSLAASLPSPCCCAVSCRARFWRSHCHSSRRGECDLSKPVAAHVPSQSGAPAGRR